MHNRVEWDEPYDGRETIRILSDVASLHAAYAGSISETLLSHIIAGDWAKVSVMEVPAEAYASPETYYHCRQMIALFSKLPFIDVGVDRRKAAVRGFFQSEVTCLRTNLFLADVAKGVIFLQPHHECALSRIRDLVCRTLGRCPTLEQLGVRFGPGATTSVKRADASFLAKLSETPHCSANLLPIVSALLAEVPAYTWCHAEVQRGVKLSDESYEDVTKVSVTVCDGRLAFVPKNAKTDRGIVIEPNCNMLLQLGIGDAIARRLRRVGIDIRDQSANQRAACTGSVNGALATLDLSSASDSISYELVKALCPDDWFGLLAMSRSEAVVYEDRSIRLHKFSSMGNGFTFPLETLIFWAISKVACELDDCDSSEVLVYGDDIIVPTAGVSRTIELLELFGFSVNLEKSFTTGAFRESCGADFLAGRNVRPFFQKDLLSCRGLYLLHNYYVRRGYPFIAEYILSNIPVSARIFGPDGYGDGHLVSDDHPRKFHKRSDGWGGYLFGSYVMVSRRGYVPGPGIAALPAYVAYAAHGASFTPHRTGENDGVSYPDLVLPGSKGYKRIFIYALNS